MSRGGCAAAALTSVLVLGLLGGCKSLGGISGAVAGAASGSATANPAVAVAVGIGVKAGVDETVNYVLRTLSHQEQALIAGQVGGMRVGERAPWAVSHPLSYGDEHGEVTVVRAFSTPLTSCKEAVFSVDRGKAADPESAAFVAQICQGAAGWNWAVAEPATARWGALQ